MGDRWWGRALPFREAGGAPQIFQEAAVMEDRWWGRIIQFWVDCLGFSA